MGNLSHLAQITHSAVIVLFAELACMSSIRANRVMEQYPGFRAAKGCSNDSFWLQQGVEMLTFCKHELAMCSDEVKEDDSY